MYLWCLIVGGENEGGAQALRADHGDTQSGAQVVRPSLHSGDQTRGHRIARSASDYRAEGAFLLLLSFNAIWFSAFKLDFVLVTEESVLFEQ